MCGCLKVGMNFTLFIIVQDVKDRSLGIQKMVYGYVTDAVLKWFTVKKMVNCISLEGGK